MCAPMIGCIMRTSITTISTTLPIIQNRTELEHASLCPKQNKKRQKDSNLRRLEWWVHGARSFNIVICIPRWDKQVAAGSNNPLAMWSTTSTHSISQPTTEEQLMAFGISNFPTPLCLPCPCYHLSYSEFQLICLSVYTQDFRLHRAHKSVQHTDCHKPPV